MRHATNDAAARRPGPETAETSGSWGKRLAWFVGLWLASTAVLGAVAYVIRAMVMP